MRNHSRRLKAIEATADEQAPLPYLIVGADRRDPTLYHGSDGQEYRAAQIPELEKHYQLIIITHDKKTEL